MKAKLKLKITRLTLFAVVAVFVLPLLAGVGFALAYKDRVYPGVTIAQINVGGLKSKDVKSQLSKIQAPQRVILAINGQDYPIQTTDFGFSYEFDKSFGKALSIGRSNNVIKNIKDIISSVVYSVQFDLSYSFDSSLLHKYLATIAAETTQEPVYPSVNVSGGEIQIDKGVAGTNLDIENIQATILKNLAKNQNHKIIVTPITLDPTLRDSQVTALTQRLESIVGKSLSLQTEDIKFPLSDNDLASLFGIYGGYNDKKLAEVVDEVSQKTDREPVNPVFVAEGNRVKEFSPAKNGLAVDKEKLTNSLIAFLASAENGNKVDETLKIPVAVTEPAIKTDEINNLGIRELIGRGTSQFHGSIASRIHNVALAASRLNGVLIPPGETFSFNDSLGDVSKFTGYQSAYVIKDGKTVLGDGGGVCQVSTTVFRAALASGLPIVERHAHSYRVYYYEQDGGPGLDATVYAPTTDLKFKNDTPSYILIQSKTDTKNLTLEFEFYGSRDGRVATISKPVTQSVTAPPDNLYQDDPTLPLGQVKQVEHKAWGAKVTFDYQVVRDGVSLIDRTFVSAYRPWQAVYLRGTAPVQ